MRIISKYILREFFMVLFLTLASFVSLYLIIDFFEKMKSFISHKASFGLISLFFLNKIPLILYYVMPMAVLLSTLIALIILSRNREIVAMKSSGISLYVISAPILASSIIISLFQLLLNETIIPHAAKKSEYIENVLIKKEKPAGFFKQNQIWYKSDNAIYSIRIFDPKDNTLKGVTLYYFDKDFNLIRRIDAGQARWQETGWLFFGVSIKNREKDGSFRSESFSKKVIPLPERPQDFQKIKRSPEEMTFSELKTYINKIRSEGYDVTEYQVDLHFKISFPFISLIMAVLGIPFALKAEKGGGIALGIAMSIFIGCGYFFIHAFNQSLGHGGVLPPLISAWLANILFGAIGALLFINAPQ